MHEDLRRRALESKKTVSRKSRSKQSSAQSSPVGSRAGSRAQSPVTSPTASRMGSRHGSDDEGDSDIGSVLGTSSIDGVLADNDLEGMDLQHWDDILQKCVNDILEPERGRRQEERERDLRVYIRILREHFARDAISASIAELTTAFLKASRSMSDDEAIAALRALQITVLTDQSEDFYDLAQSSLKDLIKRADSFPVRAEAIHALAIVTFYGTSEDEDLTEEVMSYLYDIFESDACNIGADEDADIVTAAMEAWALLATQLDEMAETSQEPMEAFFDQLHSADPRVQIGAGQDICLLYEKSYTPVEENEAVPRPPGTAADEPVPHMVKRYEPYRNKLELLELLNEIAKDSHKNLPKKLRREVHINFYDFVQSVEDPTAGPRYRKPHTGNAAEEGRYADSDLLTPRFRKRPDAANGGPAHRSNGIQAKVRGPDGLTLFPIDTWWKFVRFRALQRILMQYGFVEHYGVNEVLEETLPLGEPKQPVAWGVHWAE